MGTHLTEQDFANRCGGCGLVVPSIDLLKRLYLASFEMAESEPDMPSHAATEASFDAAMKEAHALLAAAGEKVPALSEF